MKLEESCVSSRKIYGGKVINAYIDEVELADGSHSYREYVRHNGGAAVLFVKDGKVALVKQFRYVYGKEIFEIPAGKLEKGEDACAAAVRELEEETGYRATDVSHLIDVYPSPGYTNEIIYVYLVKDATFVGLKTDEGEFLDCIFVPLDKVLAMLDSGEICDAKTACAIYKYVATIK